MMEEYYHEKYLYLINYFVNENDKNNIYVEIEFVNKEPPKGIIISFGDLINIRSDIYV